MLKVWPTDGGTSLVDGGQFEWLGVTEGSKSPKEAQLGMTFVLKVNHLYPVHSCHHDVWLLLWPKALEPPDS